MNRRSFIKSMAALPYGAKLLTENDLNDEFNERSTGVFWCRCMFCSEYYDALKDKKYYIVGVRYFNDETKTPGKLVVAVEEKELVYDAVNWIVNRLPKHTLDNTIYEL